MLKEAKGEMRKNVKEKEGEKETKKQGMKNRKRKENKM